ncbi:MAG: thioredoxin domain-containing protein [Candidatus Dojkabacteria bacterium]|nr:thioredoxin domain-containing protein [Candidatus Dojkabacteria bacterium]
MPIIINHNLCDEAPECGGIEVCPNGAFNFDKKKKRICIDRSKCTECLKCTLPDCCPVGCILYARNTQEEKRIRDRIKEDPRTAKWLWKERYGCQPAKTTPKATILTTSNFEAMMKKKGYKLIDIWHYDFLDCRAYSVLFEDLLKGIKAKIVTYKLDAQKHPGLAKILKINKFPTLTIMEDQNEIWRLEGLLKKKSAARTNLEIKKLL